MYREQAPTPGLGIACVWTRTTPADAAPREQLVVPDGCMDIIWSPDGITVAGPDTRGRVAGVRAGAQVTALRFLPGAAPHVLGLPAAELRDRTVDLADLWGAEAVRLAEEAAAGDPGAALQRAVERRLRGEGPPDPSGRAIAHALGAPAESRPGTPVTGAPAVAGGVAAAADRLGLGERQLRRRCLVLFGYGPKTLQRVLRFQRALGLARSGVPLAEVAVEAGYSDQAHLAHEVRELSGTTLGELR